MTKDKSKRFFRKIELSAILTTLGVILLFSTAIVVTLIAPSFIDPSWQQASSSYQIQMFQNADPNLYIAKADPLGESMYYVYHLKNQESVLSFVETPNIKIISLDKQLESYITRSEDKLTRLTRRLLLLREPLGDAVKISELLRTQLQEKTEASNDDLKNKSHIQIFELYAPDEQEAFAIADSDGVFEKWVDSNFSMDQQIQTDSQGYIYVNNPREFRIKEVVDSGQKFWQYNPNGTALKNLDELKDPKLGFLSRKQLIEIGQDIYRIEGCWYCHTDQTRTLIQDTVLNGGVSFPAPPSSANEYTFEKVTFPGTRRIGPDLSREGIKKPTREWHKAHFWAPKLQSPGTVMPAYRYFFDTDSKEATQSPVIPNYRFEAIYQYLMTKGTRITPPNQAWWLGEDPFHTIELIETKSKRSK